METDLTPSPSTLSSELHCPSVLDPDMHLIPKGALSCENEAFDKRKEWVLNSPTLQPTELGFAVTLDEATADGAEIPSIKDSIQPAQNYKTDLRKMEEISQTEDTPRTVRVEVTTPLQGQDNVPKHSSKLSLTRDGCIFSTPPVTPSFQEHSEHEVGDTASICELAGSPFGSPGDKKQDPVANLTEQINSEDSAITLEAEDTSTEQRGFCPTAEELNFFRHVVCITVCTDSRETKA